MILSSSQYVHKTINPIILIVYWIGLNPLNWSGLNPKGFGVFSFLRVSIRNSETYSLNTAVRYQSAQLLITVVL